mgnify:CR=1 FL=1
MSDTAIKILLGLQDTARLDDPEKEAEQRRLDEMEL